MAEDRDTEARWYVVHTYSGYENKVAQNLETIVENRRLQELIHEVKVPVELVPDIKDGKERTYYIYNNCDHEQAYRETGTQAVSFTTGVPAALGASCGPRGSGAVPACSMSRSSIPIRSWPSSAAGASVARTVRRGHRALTRRAVNSQKGDRFMADPLFPVLLCRFFGRNVKLVPFIVLYMIHFYYIWASINPFE